MISCDDILYASSYKKYRKRLYNKYSAYKDKIEKDFKVVVECLFYGLPLDDRYKAHKLVDDIWELHLVSYSSDFLLIYSFKHEDNKRILCIHAITDHDGMSKYLKSSLIDSSELLDDYWWLVIND